MTVSRISFLTLIALTSVGLAACSPQPGPQETAPTSTEPLSDTSAPENAAVTGSVQVYTLAMVAEHANPPDDCWLVIAGQVYDVSGFDQQHGGGEAVYEGCGTDATELFETRPMGSGTPHSDKARELMPNFYIGDLAP